MDTRETVKNWLRVDPAQRNPPNKADLRRALGIEVKRWHPLFQQARAEVERERISRESLLKFIPIIGEALPVREYEEPEDQDAATVLLQLGPSAVEGLAKAIKQGNAQALRLYYQLAGELDKPPEVEGKMNADELASRLFIALTELKEEGYKIGGSNQGRDRVAEVQA